MNELTCYRQVEYGKQRKVCRRKTDLISSGEKKLPLKKNRHPI